MAERFPPGGVIYQLGPEAIEAIKGVNHPSRWPQYYLAYQGAHAVQNFVQVIPQKLYIDTFRANLDLMLGAGLDVATEQAMAGPEGDVDALREDIKRFQEGFIDNWKAGIGAGMGAAFSSAMDNLINVGQMVYAFKTLAYHTAITPRMHRYYNRLYTPMEPSTSMAMALYRRGDFTIGQFKEHAAWDGWSEKNADLLVKVMEAIPSPREAFYLWAKGQITEDVRNKLYFAGGWSEEWWLKQTENWYYTPTIYDLTRIADYVELDQIWAIEQMKRRGLREKDIAKVWEMLEIRPLRDEVRLLTTHGAYCRRHGYWSSMQLQEWLADLAAAKYIRPKERELLTTYAENLYEIELKEEWIEILRWRFRTAQISEKEFLDDLTDPKGPVAMVYEKANLIVEGEKAKGYYGYY